MASLQGKTVFISGASRGIGAAIAHRVARDGANVVVTGKTDQPHPKLAGTIHSVAEEVEQLGGRALAIKLDVRDVSAIQAAISRAVEYFGGIDILVNNASAIAMTATEQTEVKRYDLMHSVNGRATFFMSKAALPYLKQSDNAHILTLSPPLNMDSKWFKDYLAYAMSKYAMSMTTLGLSAEFKDEAIAVNSLWPLTTIATAAIEYNFPKHLMQACRKPAIVADAAYHVFMQNAKDYTGQFLIDQQVLEQAGVTDFSDYAVIPDAPLYPDLFL